MVGPVNPGGGELTIAGDEVGHCYIFGSLPRVGYLYQGALGILCAQYLESGSIFGHVYVLLECFQRSFLLYTQLAKERRHNSVIVEIMDLNFIRMFLSEDKSSKKEENSPPLRESFAGR